MFRRAQIAFRFIICNRFCRYFGAMLFKSLKVSTMVYVSAEISIVDMFNLIKFSVSSSYLCTFILDRL